MDIVGCTDLNVIYVILCSCWELRQESVYS